MWEKDLSSRDSDRKLAKAQVLPQVDASAIKETHTAEQSSVGITTFQETF
jgi:hypothetical protein